jgi:pimeloyl-ACP methyl ester carboxylesterase
VIPLPQLLERRWDELPFGPFDAQHRGRLVGDREPREGPLVVLSVLAHTAVVEVDGRRRLARLQDLEVAGGHLQDCIDFIGDRHQIDQVNLLGICQGGDWSLCYAALNPERVKDLVVMVTPVDFDADRTVLARSIRALDADQLVAAEGNVSGDFVSLGFLMRSPFQRHIREYVEMVDILDDERRVIDFLRMEKWIFDSPDQCGEAFRQWVKDFHQGNKLVKGELVLGGRRVDLRRITMPVLNVYGEQDDIIPPETSARSAGMSVPRTTPRSPTRWATSGCTSAERCSESCPTPSPAGYRSGSDTVGA